MRIQILELPGKSLGPASETPFVVVISEVPSHFTLTELEDGVSFRESIGAAGLLITSESVELGPEPRVTGITPPKFHGLADWYSRGGHVGR